MSVTTERILYEDEWLLAVTKLSGELTVRGKGPLGKLPLLDVLRKQYPNLLALHRLDFETSGVVVFAKTSGVLKSVVEHAFAGWEKEYMAIALGVPHPAKGVIRFPLPARSGNGKVPASTAYEVVERLEDSSLLRLTFEHGQRHQIRRHLQMIGHPLVIDLEYGDRKANRAFGHYLHASRFYLHASRVSFPHPVTGKPLTITNPMPPAFKSAIKKLKRVS